MMNDEQGGNGRLTEVIRRAIKIAGAVKTVVTVGAAQTVETVNAARGTFRSVRRHRHVNSGFASAISS